MSLSNNVGVCMLYSTRPFYRSLKCVVATVSVIFCLFLTSLRVTATPLNHGDSTSRVVDSVEIFYIPFNALTWYSLSLDDLTAITHNHSEIGRVTLTDSLRCIRLYNAILLTQIESDGGCDDLRIAVRCYVRGEPPITWGLSPQGKINYKGKCYEASVGAIVLLFSCLPSWYSDSLFSYY